MNETEECCFICLEEALPEYGVNLTSEQIKEIAEGLSISLDHVSSSRFITSSPKPSIDWEQKYKDLLEEFRNFKKSEEETIYRYRTVLRDRNMLIDNLTSVRANGSA